MKLLVVIHLKVSQNAIFPLKYAPIFNVLKSSYLAGHTRIANPTEQMSFCLRITWI